MSTARVLKLGGSLLSVADWPERLRRWLASHPAPLNLLLVGGGDIVEAVRELDARHHFPASFSHWLCIDLLSATTRIANQLLPEFSCIHTPVELQQVMSNWASPASVRGSLEPSRSHIRSQGNLNYLVDVHSFYPSQLPSFDRPKGAACEQTKSLSVSPPVSTGPRLGTSEAGGAIEDCPLPESWQTTSDSLAAWLARVVGAHELILFKSTSPSPLHQTPTAWCEQGIVDEVFAQTLPSTVSARIVNLINWQ